MKDTEAQTVKNRRPAAGKEKPMKNTKAKLLKTAARLFASRGTEGVSTRELAGQAGVNLCAISYYFGSKQKLYEAVIDEVIETCCRRRETGHRPRTIHGKTSKPSSAVSSIFCAATKFPTCRPG